ncbi:MAG: AMP-binding protein [Clostridiales bacterium]|jgi:acyl-CoA synthetase (AMP-forming)/AMP-acid ligase II|nr:AMP-binding protein [Clostridiales bacterium]
MNFTDYIFGRTRDSGDVAYIHNGAAHTYRDSYRRILGYEALIRGCMGSAVVGEGADTAVAEHGGVAGAVAAAVAELGSVAGTGVAAVAKSVRVAETVVAAVAEPDAAAGAASECGSGALRFVAVLADNSDFFIEAYFAAIKSGYVCAPLNPAASADEISYVAAACKPEIVFVQKRYLGKFRQIFSGARGIVTEDGVCGAAPCDGVAAPCDGARGNAAACDGPGADSSHGVDRSDGAALDASCSGAPGGSPAPCNGARGSAAACDGPGEVSPAPCGRGNSSGEGSGGSAPAPCGRSGVPGSCGDVPSGRDDAIAVVLFTSGSTGKPKGVMLSHGNLRCNTESIVEYLRIGPSERALVVLPFFYCFGTSVLHTHLRAGASVVLNNEFMFPETVGEYINKYGCTSLSGVPGTYQILLRKSGFAAGKYPTLRYVAQAGGKLAPVFISELADALPGVRVVVMYGQTEATSRLSYLPPELLMQKMGSIGKGIPGTSLRVVDGRGRDVAPGEIGQIVARGGNIMKGYFGDPGATGAVLRDGALYTGDLATVDADGFIYVEGREKQIIKHAGYRISPKEIEDAILCADGVLEAVVFGMDDELLGEAPKAVVVLKSDGAQEIGAAESVTPEAGAAERIMAYCRERLPSYKVPVEIEIAEGGLPKSAAGKPLLGEIKAKYGRRRAAPGGK